MDVIEALYGRFSARAFQPRAIPKETLLKIFEAAVRAPSWADSQPWEVYLAAGATLDKLRNANLELFKSGAPRAFEVPGPAKWPDDAQGRIERNMGERLRELGLDREDKAAINSNRMFDRCSGWAEPLLGARLGVKCIHASLAGKILVGKPHVDRVAGDDRR